MTAGNHNLQWDGYRLPSGLYLVRFVYNNAIHDFKISLMK